MVQSYYNKATHDLDHLDDIQYHMTELHEKINKLQSNYEPSCDAEDDINDLKVKHFKELTQVRSINSELVKDKQSLADKLTQTESKLKHQLTLSESLYISFSNHQYDTIWSLILFMFSEVSDQVSPAILRMSDFAKKIESKEEWFSNSFFAFKEGYQMCLRVFATGTGKGEGTHVSVYLHLMKGPHDDKLKQSRHWPLRGTFTIELLNQLNDSDHHSQSKI